MNSSAPTAADERDPQQPVAAQHPEAVERALRSARRPRAGPAARADRAGRDRDRREARGGAEQRRPRPERREPTGQRRSGREARVAGRFEDARGLGHAARAGDGRDQGELRGLAERVARRQQRREREDRGQVAAAEGQRDGDERLGQRSGGEHAHALEAVGDEPGERRERDQRQQRRREQRRDRQTAARELVDLQREHDQRQQVAGRGEEDGGGEQAEVA